MNFIFQGAKKKNKYNAILGEKCKIKPPAVPEETKIPVFLKAHQQESARKVTF